MIELNLVSQKPSNEMFDKRVVSELTDEEMSGIDGGTTPWCIATVIITLVTIFAATVIAGYTSAK